MKSGQDQTVSEDDLVVAYYRITATHTGEAFGMEANGKPFAFEGTRKLRVRDGKVVEAWNRFDFLKMFLQMGVVKRGGVISNSAPFASKQITPLIKNA